MYLYQQKGWPKFTWDRKKLIQILSEVSHRQGRLIGRMEGLGFSLKGEAVLQTMTLEVLKSNEIEGEILDANQVRSSIARRLGMDIAGLIPSDRNVEGVVEMMIDATHNYDVPLTEERLFAWHASLFPTGRSGIKKIVVGTWRKNSPEDPMLVVSGAMGKEKIHFHAPEAKTLQKEMKQFIHWFNTNNEHHKLIKAAIAHLWFLTVHPFEDGNGRIARTIADMQLKHADGIPNRFYSMSSQIRIERKLYYEILEKTQKHSLDITEWLEWFLACLDRALIAAEASLSGVIKKSQYLELFNAKLLNERQKKMINKILDGFDGKLTTSKWARILKCSQDTALRDIQNLIDQGVLEKEQEGGRSTNYKLISI